LSTRKGLPIRLGLTAGQAHDGQIADTLLDPLGPRTIVLADKAYDADRIRKLIQGQGAAPYIPPKRNRRQKPCFSKRLYRERNLIERFFSKLKHYRRVATRYDKLAANFLAMVQLASMRLWLRVMSLRPRSTSPWGYVRFGCLILGNGTRVKARKPGLFTASNAHNRSGVAVVLMSTHEQRRHPEKRKSGEKR